MALASLQPAINLYASTAVLMLVVHLLFIYHYACSKGLLIIECGHLKEVPPKLTAFLYL